MWAFYFFCGKLIIFILRLENCYFIGRFVMHKIAQFEKVSLEQFKSAWKNTFLASDAEIERIYNDIKLPLRATSGSAGYDFFVPEEFLLKPNETVVVPTGVRVKIDEGWFLSVLPKSGLGFKFRLQLDNTVGIIDSDYYYSDNEGHIFVKMTNNCLVQKNVELKKGAQFCQGIFMPFGITYDDEATGVRNGGFGSTAK